MFLSLVSPIHITCIYYMLSPGKVSVIDAGITVRLNEASQTPLFQIHLIALWENSQFAPRAYSERL